MATSSVTSSTSAASTATTSTASTASQIAAANRTAAQKLMTSLSAGSGVDVTSLAQNLVDAERIPRENEINTKISKNDAKVSGYSAVKFMFSELQNAFSALKDRNSFNVLTANNSNTSAFNVTPGPLAAAGTHDVEVTRLARAQRTVSNGFAAATTPLNGGVAMKLNLTINASNITPTVATTQGVAAATEQTTITFKNLAANKSVTIGGLTLTATVDMTAADVAAAFESVAANATTGNATTGTFSGTLTGFSAGVRSGNDVTFTSVSANSNVTDLSFASSAPASVPTAAVVQGAAAVTEATTVTPHPRTEWLESIP